MGDAFETTQLWRRTLAKQTDLFEKERDRLRDSYLSLRKKVAVVVSRVSAIVPQLTQHEISHLDGLWEVADVVVGEDFPVNPLEAYVFGAAVLFHDAGLCPEAYDGGLTALRSTLEWKDALEFEKKKNLSQNTDDAADFATLRILHAKQANILASRFWVDPDTTNQVFLIEDEHIRKHLGQLIGQIAASHNWTIEDVQSQLGSQFNAIADFPREWRIDPIKLACMLRCADAGHINNSRAPDFLHALLKRTGVSFHHWQAQNWLSRVDVDQSDNSKQTILLTSTRDFDPSHVNSWWVAYDAARVLDKELRSCNALLECTKGIQFQTKRVKGVHSPELMSQFITVRNWKPCAAELHIGNVEGLVKSLGGEKLYGAGLGVDNLQVVIRELIQNSRDAIRARKTFDKTFDPKIVVAVRHETEGPTPTTWIDVFDSGVGMSRRVLTGPLLDFGSSFWATDLVHKEFPGLRSSNFQPVGEFGIGFFSVFMVSDFVEVSTRRFDEGLNNIQQLTFSDGVMLRPVLKSGPCSGFPSWCSTKVSLKLTANYAGVVKSGQIPTRHDKSHDDLYVPFSDYIATIVAGLDVCVIVQDKDGFQQTAHHGHPLPDIIEIKNWLKRITFCNQRPDSGRYANYIDSVADRLRPIVEDGRQLGFATLNTFLQLGAHQDIFSVHTIGGLACNVHERGQPFVGFMDCKAQSAKRSASGEFAASEATLKAWAEEQYSLLKSAGLDIEERLRVGPGLCTFKVDPIDFAVARVVAVSGTFALSCDELAMQLNFYDFGIYISPWGDDYAECYTPVRPVEGMLLLAPVNIGDFNKLTLYDNIPVKNFSLIDCIHRASVRQKLSPNWRVVDTEAINSLGKPMKMLRCSIERDQLPNNYCFEVLVH